MAKHDNMPDLPKPDEGQGEQTPGPPLDCLTDEERLKARTITAEISLGMVIGSNEIMSLALNKATDEGSHLVGHVMELLVYAAGAVSHQRQGLGEPDSVFLAHVDREDASEEHKVAAAFATEYCSLVLNRHYDEAMDYWFAFLATEPDYSQYQHAVLAVLNVVTELVTGEFEKDENGTLPGLGTTFTLKHRS